MATTKTSGKIAGFFDNGKKIATALISLVIVVYTVSVFFYKLNLTLTTVDQIKIDQKHIHEEDVKDNKNQFDDQKDLILKVMARNRELEKELNEYKIQDAYWKGKVETILKMK